jgi:hypothetical protein
MKRILLLATLVAASVAPALGRNSSKTDAGLAKLAPSDRFQQVCDIALMEKLRHEKHVYHPDSVIAYALEDPNVSGDTLHGDGGAFRSHGVWYQYSFTCAATPDRMKVLSLEYTVGDAVPKSEWGAHGLSIH